MPIKETVTGTLAELQRRADNPTPALRRLVPWGRDVWAKVFSSEGTYGGGTRWLPLSPSTLFRRLTDPRGSPGQPPTRTGTPFRSLTQSGRYSRTGVDQDGLHVGSSDPVLNLLIGGTRKMPARDPLPERIEDSDINSWAQVILDFVMEGKE